MKSAQMYILVTILSLFFYSSAMADCALPKFMCVTECMDYSTHDRISCYAKKQNEAESSLKQMYSKIVQLCESTDPLLIEQLQSSQSAWETYREANCKVYKSIDRELRGANERDCILRMTRKRANDLRLIVEDINR